jgi:two-component system, OmpR family, KDP operon response regulator KdpE
MFPARILLVDGDPGIQRVVGPLLRSRGFDVEIARTGTEALRVLSAGDIDLILLELKLPDISGLDLCRRVRRESQTPVLVASAVNTETEKVLVLDAGADDYVTKPCGSEELVARIRAVLRRTFPEGRERAGSAQYGDFSIDYDRRRVMRGGEEIRLTPKEFDLLALLARHRGRILTHRGILRSIWGPHATGQMDALWVLVRQVRRKIEPDPSHPRYVLSERWVGYRFESPSATV